MLNRTKNKNIGIVVQARVGSTRLPRKIFMDIEGKPMLARVIDRLKKIKKAGRIIVAIPDTKENAKLGEMLAKNKIDFFKGKEKDVLDRYYNTAKKFGLETIVRITSDCPLIDYRVADLVIKKHFQTGADYTSNAIKSTFPRGLDVEVFGFNVLERAHKEAKKIYQREHVTQYMREHPEKFRLLNIESKKDFSCMRWTVDEAKDLEFVREIYKNLYRNKKMFLTQDILTFLEKHPEIENINKNVRQKIICKTI
jgi:spore coat polysaccharide biosynthesis protein SpsF (cytidylyltransferase family)